MWSFLPTPLGAVPVRLTKKGVPAGWAAGVALHYSTTPVRIETPTRSRATPSSVTATIW
jgi:hypothetical protein